MARQTPQVHILESKAAVEKARAAGQAYAAAAPPAADVSLEFIGRAALDQRQIDAFARAGEPLREQLRAIASGAGARAVAASAALVLLGEDAYAARIPALLSDETTLGECCKWIGMSEEVVARLPNLHDSRQLIERVAQTPHYPERVPAVRAAYVMGSRIASDDIVDALVQAARSTKYPDFRIIRVLARIARRGDDLGLRAARLLLQPDVSGPWKDHIDRLRDPRLVPDLERLLASDAKPEVRLAALMALAHMQRMGAMPRLLESLESGEGYFSVAPAIGVAAEGTGDESIVAALAMAAAGQKGTGPHAVAIARIGGPLAWRTLAGLSRRANVFDAMTMAWRAKGVTASSAIQRFVDAGVIAVMPTEAELAAAAYSEYAWEPNDVWLFMHFLRDSGRITDALGQDDEAQDAARHPLLIERIARAAGGKLPIDAASQIDGPPDGHDERELQIQIVSGNRGYQVTAKAFQRNYDFVAVRALLNTALLDRGSNDRFTRLQPLDAETWVFGPKAAVESACDDLFIPRGTEHAEVDAWRDRLEALFLQRAVQS